MKALHPIAPLNPTDVLTVLSNQEMIEQKISKLLRAMEDGVNEWNLLVDPASSGTPDPDSSRIKHPRLGDLRSAFRHLVSEIQRLESLVAANRNSLARLNAQTRIKKLGRLVADPVAGEFVKYVDSELTTDIAPQADSSVRGLSDVDFESSHSNLIMVVDEKKKLRPTTSVDFGKKNVVGNYREEVRKISIDTYIESPAADDKYVYLEPTLGYEPEITYPSWMGGSQSFILNSPATLYYHHEIGGFVRIK